jgi:hypothetical protein
MRLQLAVPAQSVVLLLPCLRHICSYTASAVVSCSDAFASSQVAGVQEEVQLREQDFGNFQDAEGKQREKAERLRYGRFFYRCGAQLGFYGLRRGSWAYTLCVENKHKGQGTAASKCCYCTGCRT